MPVPGPRGQTGPDPGYFNPGMEQPNRFNLWDRPAPVTEPGRSPGMMIISRRGNVLGVGQIRRLWRQAVDVIPAQSPYSWSTNSPAPGRPAMDYQLFGITRALRYMTRSVYIGAGNDGTRYAELHTVVKKSNRHKPVTIGGGQVPGRPTIRNRMTSFGSRVPALNNVVVAASNQPPASS
jgi:hypothetical protein